MKEGSSNGASLSEGTPRGGPGGSVPSLGIPIDMLVRLWNGRLFP